MNQKIPKIKCNRCKTDISREGVTINKANIQIRVCKPCAKTIMKRGFDGGR